MGDLDGYEFVCKVDYPRVFVELYQSEVVRGRIFLYKIVYRRDKAVYAVL